MIKRLLLLVTLGALLQGCYMVPLAFIGPATSGFSTASIVQASFTTGANLLVEKTTGKSISEHALASLDRDVLFQAYTPQKITKISQPK